MQATPPEPIARLAELLECAEGGRRLQFDDLRELAGLYRRCIARLSQLRTRNRDPEAIRYLNSLCVRAYPYAYAPRRVTRSFAWQGLPRALARSWPAQLLVLGLLGAGAIVGSVLVGEDPRHLRALVPFYPAAQLEELATSREARAEFLGHRDIDPLSKTLFGASLFANNTSVGLFAFATGVLAGVPTVLLVVYNGMMLGGFCTIFAGDPEPARFWSWLLPHAIPELLAVILCATAGLLIGSAALAPGRRGALALREAGEHALHLVLASVPLFVAAALVESFVRESTLSSGARFAFAAGAVLLIAGYGVAVIRLARREPTLDLGWLH